MFLIGIEKKSNDERESFKKQEQKSLIASLSVISLQE